MPQIGDAYRVIASGRLFNVVETRNMFSYVLVAANGTDDQCAVALEAQIASMFNNLKSALSHHFEVYQTETQKWYPTPGQTNVGYWQTYHVTTQAIVGTLVSDIIAYQAAVLITLKTAAKKVLGRKFLAGMTEDNTTDGLLVAGMVTVVGQFLTAMLAPVVFGAGGDAHPGVMDKTGTFREFLGGKVGSIISTMRRRKPGYGI